jgi:hypothetical protein
LGTIFNSNADIAWGEQYLLAEAKLAAEKTCQDIIKHQY